MSKRLVAHSSTVIPEISLPVTGSTESLGKTMSSVTLVSSPFILRYAAFSNARNSRAASSYVPRIKSPTIRLSAAGKSATDSLPRRYSCTLSSKKPTLSLAAACAFARASSIFSDRSRSIPPTRCFVCGSNQRNSEASTPCGEPSITSVRRLLSNSGTPPFLAFSKSTRNSSGVPPGLPPKSKSS